MSGSLLSLLDGAEVLLADSAEFRARVGAADAAAAKSRIHYWESDPADYWLEQYTLSEQRPFALLMVTAHGYRQIGQDASHHMGAFGGLIVLLSDNPKYPDSPKQSYRDFVDWTSLAIDECAENFGKSQSSTVPYYPFLAAELVQPPERSSLVDRQSDDFFEAAWMFRAAVQGGS
jgi:hypothetical protein